MNSELVVTVDDLPADVLEAIDRGRKVEAIKLLREATGLGLANAKVLVDRAAAQRTPRRAPPGLVEEQGGASRLLKGLLLVALGIVLYHFFLRG